MRLSELYFNIKGIKNSLKVVSAKDTSTGKVKISNIAEINLQLNKLREYTYFDEEFSQLSNLPFVGTIAYSPATVEQSTAIKYEAIVGNISSKLSLIENLCLDYIPQLSESTICISAPQNIGLNELPSFISNINKALNMLNNMPNMEGNISFEGVEHGSDWFYYIVDGVKLLTGITIILKMVKTIVIESTITYKTIKAANLVESSNINLEQLQKGLITTCVNNEETFENLSTEDKLRLINASILIASEITKGAKAEIALLNRGKSEEELDSDKLLNNCINDLKMLSKPDSETDD